MKRLILTSILALLVASGTTVMAQDYSDEYLGLPGDNLNLYAVMKLFQESETLEGFERSLNDENSRINNLDLNGDNLVDYITVSDFVDGDVHNIVLRAMLGQKEYQDVAVFTVQKFRDGSVQIQLVGDEDLYGKNYIIEPIYDETPNPGYTGRPSSRVNVTVVRTTPYEVSLWPVVRFIYLPDYVLWRSSWYWGYYPVYWRPWNPFYWHYYYGYHYNWYHHYYRHYRHWDNFRYNRYHDFYYSGIRAYSPVVVVNINKGYYKTTYSHPEQRRDGEALFTKSNPDRTLRTQDNTPVSQYRRPVSQPSQSKASEGTSVSTARRSAPASNERVITKSSSGQTAGRSTNPQATVRERPVTKSSSEQNAGVSRRPSATTSERTVTKSSSQQNVSSSRRSEPNVSAKSAPRPQSAQRTQSAGTSRSSSSGVRSSAGSRSSSSESKGKTTSTRSEKSKSSDDKKTTRSR